MCFQNFMDNINNINFTGIKNIEWVEFSRKPPTVSKSLSMVLSDDFSGNDLSEFKSVINKVTPDFDKFKNNISKEIINIECISGCGQLKDTLCLNGKELNVTDENLPIFTYIAKITKKIGSLTDKNFIVNEDYKDFVANDSLIYGIKFTDNIPSNISRVNLFNQFFEKDKVKISAHQVNDFIQNIMNKYFEVI